MEQSSVWLVLASLQHEHKYALILFSIKVTVFVKTYCRVISCFKVEVRKPELKNIYEANHWYGDSYLFNRMDLEIPLEVR